MDGKDSGNLSIELIRRDTAKGVSRLGAVASLRNRICTGIAFGGLRTESEGIEIGVCAWINQDLLFDIDGDARDHIRPILADIRK